MAIQLSEILQLSIAERIQLAEDIWDSIAAFPENVALTETQKEELDRRIESYAKAPNEGVSWVELKQNLITANY